MPLFSDGDTHLLEIPGPECFCGKFQHSDQHATKQDSSESGRTVHYVLCSHAGPSIYLT